MKTLQNVQKEKSELLKELQQYDSILNQPSDDAIYNNAKKETKRINKRLEFIKTIEMYLQTNPTEEFVQKEFDRLTNRLRAIREKEPKYPENEAYVPYWKQQVAAYNKTMGVSDVQMKLSTLKYLLN